MLAEILLAAAVGLTPAAVAAPEQVPTRGVHDGPVIWKWHDDAEPQILWMPPVPECWGLRVMGPWSVHNICVDRAVWDRTPLFSQYVDGA